MLPLMTRASLRSSLALVTIGVASGLLIACGGGSDDEASEPTKAPAATSAGGASASPASSSATRTASPAAVASVNAADIEARFAQTYKDSFSFVPRASVDELKVTFNASSGILTVSVRPLPTSANTIGGNSKFLGGPANDTLQITAQSALLANKVAWASFPEVKRVYTTVLTEFTLSSGAKNIENAAGISVDRATGVKMDFEALKTSVPAQPRSFFCAADAYAFHVVVYPTITDKGCLTGPLKGTLP